MADVGNGESDTAGGRPNLSVTHGRVRSISTLLGFLRFGFATQPAAHPWGNARQVVKALANVPLQGWRATLPEIARLLTTIDTHPAAARADKLCSAIGKLNEFAQVSLAEAWAKVLKTNAPGSAAIPQQVLVSYYRAIHAACCYCQDLADREPPGKHPQQFHATLSTLAIHALGMEKKLQRFHYLRPEEQWWASVHWQLNQARRHACDSCDVSIGNPETPSNALREYKYALFFELAPLDNFTPRQMEALDLTLRKFEKYLPLLSRSAGSEPYCVDTAFAQGPAKRKADARYAATVSYIGFDLLRPPLQRQILRMKHRFPLTDWLLPSRCSQNEALSMLETLARAWSSEPPQRQQPRHQRPASISIGLGLDVLHQMLSEESSAPPTAIAAERRTHDEQRLLPAPVSVVRLLDVSEQGIGVLLPHGPGKFAVGALACFQPEAGLAWRVGIVRRLSQHTPGLSTCGIEQFAGRLVPAWLMTAEDETGNEPERCDTFDVVLQPGTDGQEHRILLPSGFYKEGKRYLLCVHVNVKHIDIILTHLVEHGSDFECAAFIALAPETADSCHDYLA